MRILDQLFGWILVGLGGLHCAFTFRYYGGFSLAAIWVFSGGIAIMLAGFLNISRAQAGKSSGVLGFGSVFANLFVIAVGIAVLLTVRHSLSANPQVPILLAVGIVEFAFSVRGK